MRFWISAISALVVLAGTMEGSRAVELITNGTFEGGFVASGTSHILDGLPDSIPIGWTRFENFSGGGEENSLIGPFTGNGPSASGSTAVHFQRTNGHASGDWTVIRQDLDFNVADIASLNLSVDVMVIQHDLVAGGWVNPAFEWPLMVQVKYVDTNNSQQFWRHGWYLANPGDGVIIDDPGVGLIPIYQDTLVNGGVWVASNFNLLNELPLAQTIQFIQIGGSGWNFESNLDNVSMQWVPPWTGEWDIDNSGNWSEQSNWDP